MLTQRTSTQLFKRAIALLFVAVLGIGAVASAQAQDAGYIDQQLILSEMPEMQQVQQQLQQEMQNERQQLQAQQQQFQQQVQKYQQQRQMLSEESRKQREKELQQQQAKIQQAAMERDRAMAQKRQELMQPVIEKLQGTIDAVAEERGLDYVVRAEALLYVDDEAMVDLTDEVAGELGVDLSESTASTGAGPSDSAN